MSQNQLEVLIRSRIPLIVIETHEENQAVSMIVAMRPVLQRPIFKWSLTEGFERLDQKMPAQKLFSKPTDALAHIKSVTTPGVYILADFHPFMDEPMHVRLLKDIALSADQLGHTVIMISHEMAIPVEIRKLSAKLELSLPDRIELEQIVRTEARHWTRDTGKKVQTDSQTLSMLVNHLAGVSRSDAQRLARNAIYDDGAISQSDIPAVTQAKYKLLSEDGNLHFEYDTAKFSDIAGFERLKQWLNEREPFFTQGNLNTGLPTPKGVLLLGVQGCGKSLAAKAVAGAWQAPLLRLDFGSLYDKYYGETEKNLRDALKTAEVMSPCVLWLDEIEKGLVSGDDDSGPAKRILGTLLTWMAEKKAPVFLVATANDITALPPELVRKGRFDEIFFVDLPNDEVRYSIFDIHLKRQKLDPQTFDILRLVESSVGFSGAEIEQAVISAYYSAHAQSTTMTQAFLLDALHKTQPLSVVMDQKIEQLRLWASSRTVPCD